MRRFDLVVLDFDGTVADSQALLVGMVNETLAANGLARADERHVAWQIGSPLARVFEQSAPGIDADTNARLCAYFRTHADAMDFVRQFKLFPGALQTLAALHRHGARLVIGTSKARATTSDIVRHCGLDELIDEIIGGDSVTCGKPHPEMIERARTLFGATRERTLMVGDSLFDVEMGIAAGVATCAVTYGMQEEAALRRLDPTFVIDRIEELEGLVKI